MLLDIATRDGTADAYLAHPAAGTGPGVPLFVGAVGLRPRIEDMADRVASWGYVDLTPNVFCRNGIAGLVPDGPSIPRRSGPLASSTRCRACTP